MVTATAGQWLLPLQVNGYCHCRSMAIAEDLNVGDAAATSASK